MTYHKHLNVSDFFALFTIFAYAIALLIQTVSWISRNVSRP
jgi:hypothetical protein